MAEDTQGKAIQDPFLIQDIIFALSDPVRTRILMYLSKKGEKDTGTIASALSKSTNTILYHLNILKDAELINSTLKSKKGREIYHWFLLNRKISLEIDLGLWIPREHSLDTYLLRILIYYKNQGLVIDEDFQEKTSIDEIASLLKIDLTLAKIIIKKMELTRIIDVIYRKVHSDLIEYKKNRRKKCLNWTDIQEEWNLTQESALKIFYMLLQTGKFVIDRENRISTF